MGLYQEQIKKDLVNSLTLVLNAFWTKERPKSIAPNLKSSNKFRINLPAKRKFQITTNSILDVYPDMNLGLTCLPAGKFKFRQAQY